MRILLINGNTTAAITDRCAAAARAAATPGTEIVPLTAKRGPRIIGTRAENALAGAAVIELLAENAGSADAAIIAISFDTLPFPAVVTGDNVARRHRYSAGPGPSGGH